MIESKQVIKHKSENTTRDHWDEVDLAGVCVLLEAQNSVQAAYIDRPRHRHILSPDNCAAA